jgi:lactoylglutathione lyase
MAVHGKREFQNAGRISGLRGSHTSLEGQRGDPIVGAPGLWGSFMQAYHVVSPLPYRNQESPCMSELAITLVVIRSANMEQAVLFYRRLGLSFTKERHGSGPEHYACEIGTTVFEIYPSGPESPAPSAVRLGFRVPSLDDLLAELRTRGVEIVSAPRSTPWGRRAVVMDPDGNRVEISE